MFIKHLDKTERYKIICSEEELDELRVCLEHLRDIDRPESIDINKYISVFRSIYTTC